VQANRVLVALLACEKMMLDLGNTVLSQLIEDADDNTEVGTSRMCAAGFHDCSSLTVAGCLARQASRR
jgi:hypothetical protein